LCGQLSLVAGLNVTAQEPEINFSRDIQPILSENCYFCHGPDGDQREADLRLDVEEEVKATLEPGDSHNSDLFLRIKSDDPDEVMPPADSNRSLTKKQIDLIRRWIDSGAQWEKHWAFRTTRKAQIPDDQAIDFFIERRLQDSGLPFSPRADKATLIRRVSLDLTGLPPTGEELQKFLSDKSPDAYSKMIDCFLSSPAYGERMAWIWLDAARYADSNGYQGDNERTMWPWRDWVINAYNENMPFDQFSKWQLAGDLYPNATYEQRLATGFNRNHPINGEGGRIPEENRIDYVMDMAETTGTIWMGLTFNCCRCHDHKYDQLSQKDYYGLFAFFNQTPITGEGGNAQTAPVLAAPTEEQTKQKSRINAKIAELQSQQTARAVHIKEGQPGWESDKIQELGSADSGDIRSDFALALGINPSERTENQANLVRQKFHQNDVVYSKLQKKLDTEKKRLKKINQAIPKVMVMADQNELRKTFRLNRGSYQEPREEVFARVPEILGKLSESTKADRKALADWLFDNANPLTPRVAVNRLWAQVFGIGLVKTTEDFGVQGEPPTHPKLLDWLAAEYRESGWDTKRMLRLILNSQTYQQSSKTNPRLQDLDPENRLLGRSPRYRMPAWMLRDSALASSSRLVRKLGGEPVNTYQPSGVWEEASFGKKKFKLDQGDALYRRSIYTFWRRIAAPTMFFDNADRMTCSVKTNRTNTPLHALNTLNDVTFVEAARIIASAILSEESEDVARLDKVFNRVMARPAKKEESRILLEALNRTRKQFKATPKAANAFISIGQPKPDPNLDAIELASWTSLCLAVLNLDEALTRQ